MKQQPIGYIDVADLRELCNGNERQYSLFTEDKGRMVAIYAAPVRTKDMTDDEIAYIWRKYRDHITSTLGFARAVIAADREKNKLEQAEQEPVVKPMDKAERENWYKEVIAATEDVIAEKERIAEHRALITRNNAIIVASQQPVKELELTDDEIAEAVGSPLDEVYLADFRAVIAAYKEKNK